MADLDNTIKSLEHCYKGECVYDDGERCPYVSISGCTKAMLSNALELLKEKHERIKVLEEEAKTKDTPQKVLNRKELADLIVGECPLCGALLNNEICPTSCGWCGCLLDWKDGDE